MKATESPELETKDRERIYNYVEQNGAVPPEALMNKDIVRVDPQRCRQLIAIMKRDGYLVEEDGLLRVSLDFEETGDEEYAKEDFDFTIRKARQEDISGVVGVMRQVAEEGTYIEAESVAQQIDFEETLIRHNEITSRVVFVATIDSEVIGWCHVESSDVTKLSHTAELTVGLLEEYRGHDIGSHLLQRGLEWAASNGYEKVYQSLPATNQPGIDFLEEHDWYQEARRENHYRIDGKPVDEVMMAHNLA